MDGFLLSSTTAAFVWAPPTVTLDVPVARAWKWDSDCHINLKELSSLHVALKAQPGLRNVRIRWACDNSSCVDIVRQLHSRSPPMCAILREIVLLCRSRCIEILPEWVSTRVQLADGPSRSTVAGPYICASSLDEAGSAAAVIVRSSQLLDDTEQCSNSA